MHYREAESTPVFISSFSLVYFSNVACTKLHNFLPSIIVNLDQIYRVFSGQKTFVQSIRQIKTLAHGDFFPSKIHSYIPSWLRLIYSILAHKVVR